VPDQAPDQALDLQAKDEQTGREAASTESDARRLERTT
jgi:hypothetical protein